MEGILTKIFRQAFLLVKGNKILWPAGLFLVWPNLFISISLLYWIITSIDMGGSSGGVLLESSPNPINPSILLGIISVIILTGLFFMYFRSKSFVVLLIRQLKNKKSADLKKVWGESRFFVKGLANLSFVWVGSLIVISYLVIWPISNLMAQGMEGRAWALAGVALALFLPVIFVLYVSFMMATMFSVAYKLTTWDSIRVSIDLVRKFWRGMVGFIFGLMLFEVFGFVLSSLLLVAVVQPFVLLNQIFYDMGGQQGVLILQGLAGTLGFMVFFISQALVSVFSRVAWAVLFLEIIKPIKSEPEPVSEVMAESVPTE